MFQGEAKASLPNMPSFNQKSQHKLAFLTQIDNTVLHIIQYRFFNGIQSRINSHRM